MTTKKSDLWYPVFCIAGILLLIPPLVIKINHPLAPYLLYIGVFVGIPAELVLIRRALRR